MTHVGRDDLDRYARIVGSLIRPSPEFALESETGSAIQVERGIIFPNILAAPGTEDRRPLVDHIPPPNDVTAHPNVVDCAGHTRASYAGLLVYCWANACRVALARNAVIEGWQDPLTLWCGVLEMSLGLLQVDRNNFPASLGAETTGAAWSMLALYAAGGCLNDRRWINPAHDFFRSLVAPQQENGAFLYASQSDNPETRWYHEQVLLHAAASYAAQSKDERVEAAVLRAAEYHLNESQPDHASTQPWGLLAFIWNADARSLADQLLHSIQIQYPAGVGGISSMLLADCLYCLPLIPV